MEAVANTEAKQPRSMRRWGRRLGIAGFCFFFFKGMLWLIIPAWFVMERGCADESQPESSSAEVQNADQN